MYEVEQKFPVVDKAGLEGRLAEFAARWSAPVDQVDLYYAHPSRDFGRTDEALRLRRTGDEVAITWKGPRLDGVTKTRREIELPLAGGDGPDKASAVLDRWSELLEALGFRRVREVAKRRRQAVVRWQDADVDIALDHVAGLGSYVELELRAMPDGLAEASARIESLAHALGCTQSEPRSYLELLLTR